MRADDAGQIIRLLSAAYPTYPVGEDTFDLYAEALMPRDAEAALAAARHWITTQAQFPRINELLAAVRSETVRRTPPPPALPEPTRPRLTREEIRAMRPPGVTHGHDAHRHRRPGADRTA